MRKINQAGIDLMKRFEGFRAEAYPDPGFGEELMTIGYGSTRNLDGSPICKSQVVTKEKAEELFKNDLERFESQVDQILKHIPLNKNEFSALVSLCYNCGTAPIQEGNTIREALEVGHYDAAADGFLLWEYSNGKVLEGLTRRREAERELFLQSKPEKFEPTDEFEMDKEYLLLLVEPTYLKYSTVQASELPEEQKILCDPGESDLMIKAIISGHRDNHYALIVDAEYIEGQKQQEAWFAYKPHWEVYKKVSKCKT